MRGFGGTSLGGESWRREVGAIDGRGEEGVSEGGRGLKGWQS